MVSPQIHVRFSLVLSCISPNSLCSFFLSLAYCPASLSVLKLLKNSHEILSLHLFSKFWYELVMCVNIGEFSEMGWCRMERNQED